MGQVLHGSATTTERLCRASSVCVAPWGVVPKDGVEDREKLAHHGDEDDLLRAAAGRALIVERPKGGAASDCSVRCHVRDGPH